LLLRYMPNRSKLTMLLDVIGQLTDSSAK